MLYLLVQIDGELYGIAGRQVIEVLPIIRWRKLPQAPRGIPGLINYHGQTIPVVDLNEILTGRPSSQHNSTRIIVCDQRMRFGKPFPIAVVVEQILETITIPEADFADSRVSTPDTSYAGPFAITTRGVVQRLDLEGVLAPEIGERLISGVREREVEIR